MLIIGRKQPFGKEGSNLSRVASLFAWKNGCERSFPEAFLEISVEYDNGSMSFRGEIRALDARKSCLRSVYSDKACFSILSWKFLILK